MPLATSKAKAPRTTTEATAADPVTAFDSWLRTARRDLAEGERLARARRPVFQQLIATDPQAALAQAIPPELRASLPAEIAVHLEAPVSGTGRLSVTATCALPGHPGHLHTTRRALQLGERRYTVHAYGRALAFPSQEAFVAHGIVLGDDLALAEPAETVRPAVSRSWTQGEKTVLWLRVEFPDDLGSPVSDATIQQTMAEVNTFYGDVSHGQCTLRTVILPGVLRLPFTKASITGTSSDVIEQQALALARTYDALNGNAGTYHPDRADRVIVISKTVPSFLFGGVGEIGASGVYLNGFVNASLVAHELGHNHGLQHAHAWRPTSTSPTGPGTHVEYGDLFDVMGATSISPIPHFNTKSKADLFYLADQQVQLVETAGTYRIYRHDHRAAEGSQALKLVAGDYDYWVEHRRLQNNTWAQNASRFQNGIQIRWGRYAPTPGGVGTYLLDGRPATPNDQTDAPITLGETFTDLAHGVSFTPVAVGGASPLEWIDVRVDYGALPGSENRDPVLSIELPAATVPARTAVALRATVSDPDGDATLVRWNFGDGTADQTGTSITHRFSRGGTFRIRCTVTDGKGGFATQVGSITVDDPLQSWSSVATLPAQRYSLAHNGRELLAIGTDVYSSVDGLNWTRRATLANHLTFGVATTGPRCVAVGVRRDNTALGSIQVSTDGTSWQPAETIPPPPKLNAVAYGAGRFVAVGESGAVLHSAEGLSWSPAPSITTRELLAIHFAADRFVAVGRQGTVITSRDGLLWENRSSSTADLYGVTYFHGGWYVNASGSLRAANAEVRDWVEISTTGLGFAWGLHSVGDELLLARGDRGSVLYSDDRSNWYTVLLAAAPSTDYATGFVFVDDRIYLATTDGRILRTSLRSLTTSLPQPLEPLVSQTAPAGQNVVFTVGQSQAGVTYQWYKNGQPLAGQTGASLQFTPAQPSDSGSYHVTLTNLAGTTTTPAVTLAVDPSTARLVNLSVRTRLAAASDIFTLGFVVGPSRYTRASPGPKLLLARAAGPALAALGVGNALPDPRLELFSGNTRLNGNDDWAAALLGDFQAVGAFSFPTASKDAALRASLELRPYTLQLASAPGGSGEVLAELYDLDPEVLDPKPYAADPPRLINVSARGPVSAAAPLIGGFVLRGTGTRTLLIRAAGPALAGFGVTDALAAPTLTILAGDRIQATNTTWGAASDPAALRVAAASVGAFPLPEGSRDSAALITLPAGAYTAQISAPAGSTGTVLLEVYEVP